MTIKASSQITISKVIDIHACYRYYKLQGSILAKPTKPTKNPPDGWSDTEPAYISGSTNTLYFVDCNVYSDKSFSFSEVSKSSSYEAAKDAWNKANKAQDTATNAQNKVDNLQVGGRNLARQTSSEWSDWHKPSNNTMNNCGNFCNIYPDTKKKGDTYTVSFDIDVKKFTKGSAGNFDIFLQGSTDSGWSIGNPFTNYNFRSKALAGNFTEHVSYQCTISSDAQATANVFSFGYRCDYSDGTGQFRIRNIKVEKGNKATDWTPAPEDIDNRFDAAETRITQAETSIETTNNQIALKASTETVTEIYNRANQLDKALSDALVTINKNRDAIATLTARDFKVQFTTLTNQLTQLNGDLTSYKKEVGNWMRFDADGNLVLGATREEGQDAYELKLTKNRISFMLNDVEVAYISNNELYITNSTVVQNLKIGRFVWEVRGNGNLGLVWR